MNARSNTTLVLELRKQLGQVIFDIDALSKRRSELLEEIASALAEFKVGDVVIGAKRKPMKIRRIVGRAAYIPKDKAIPEVRFFYAGQFVLKDGSLGKSAIDTEYDCVLGDGLRLATPSEIPQPAAKVKA